MRDGETVYLCGMTRSGKTLTAERETKNEPRLGVWDPKGSWAKSNRCHRVDTTAALRDLLLRAGRGPLRVALVPTLPTRPVFDAWAAMMFAWIKGAPGVRTVVVAEEIANVTSVAKAPPGWHRLITQALEFGPTIYAITQSPAEADKTVLRNSSRVRTFAMVRDVDQAAIARELGVAPERVAALKPLEFIERDMRTHAISSGKLSRPRS